MSGDARPGDPAARCLSDQEIASLPAAVPGQAPLPLARHLASCERCQARALFGSERRPGRRKARPEPPTLGRALLYSALVLAAMAAFFWTLRMLFGPGD
jgi:hypothetical protein